MKYLYIFVLFLIACSDVTVNKCTPFEVTISDALPIQFWLNDCDTYNEKEVCGVHHKCWCQPWNCDDDLVIQFTDDSVNDYVLRVLNSDLEVEFESEFDYYQQYPGNPADIFEPFPLSGWTNEAVFGLPPWTTGTTPSVTVFITVWSALLKSPVNVQAGTFDVNVTVTNNRAAEIYITFFKAGVAVGDVTIPSAIGISQVRTGEVTITDTADEVKITAARTTGFSTTVTIENIETDIDAVSATPVVFFKTFNPLDHGICNKQLNFQIVDQSGSPEVVVAKSDCIDVRTSHNCVTEIEYTNNRNFAGLVYENVSPLTTFKILVPAIFFHERFPEEDNVIELSDSIIKTSGQVKAQRLFETDYIPYYMHRKLKLILKHQTVLIDNQYWTKEESYDVLDGERRWPAKKGKCFLTEKNYVQRAIL